MTYVVSVVVHERLKYCVLGVLYCRYETRAQQEKCVDISLAVEMLFMATIPSAYDIAVIVTGDKDFIPALQKTRLLGKRVAIVSFRNSVNPDLIAPDARTKDFNVIWVDDYLDHLVVPIVEGKLEKGESLFAICCGDLSQ